MARSDLTRALARVHRSYASSRPQADVSRGLFLAGAGVAAAAAVAAGTLLRPHRAPPTSNLRIAIIGGGVAGLTCAYRLRQAGFSGTIYEAGSRLGGRVWTLNGFFPGGQFAEHGGEFISTEHRAARGLAAELGLKLLNVDELTPPGWKELYSFDGVPYTYAQAVADYGPVYDKLSAAAKSVGYPTTHAISTPAGRELDRISIDEWIERNVPGGLRSQIGKLLSIDNAIEKGADSSQQSALNLIYLLGNLQRDDFTLAGSDEAFRIAGGNDQLVSRLAAALPPGSIEREHVLVALRQISDGSYRCTFQNGKAVSVDHVVLALPFATLRHVDTTRVSFSAVKRLAIQRLPMGNSSKLNVQVKSRLWNKLGFDGTTFSDLPYQSSWDATVGQPGAPGILAAFPGGRHSILNAPAHAPSSAAHARLLLDGVERLFPGIANQGTGAAFLDVWPNDRWTLGSYCHYGIGDSTAFGGSEGVREGNVHFCGEHTSYDFQGYINGAVATGQRVASEIAGLPVEPDFSQP